MRRGSFGMNTDALRLHALLKELRAKQEPIWLLTEMYADVSAVDGALKDTHIHKHAVELFEVFRAHLERLELVPGCTWQRKRLQYFEECVGLMFRFVSDHGRHPETEQVRAAVAWWLEDIERHLELHASLDTATKGLVRQALVRAWQHLKQRTTPPLERG